MPTVDLATAVERSPLVRHVGKSGAGLERVLLADGRRLIVKRFSPDRDLMMRLTHDTVGREYQLWSRGILDQLPDGLGHPVIDGWIEQDATVLVMRDLGDAVRSWDDRLSRASCRRLLSALSTMYQHFLGRAPEGLTALTDLIGLFAPHRIAPHVDAANDLPPLVLRGWEIFADTVEPAVARPVARLLADPTPLAEALLNRPTTLIHGDLATVNVAFEPDRVTLIDWGMPAAAPAAVDVAMLLAGCASVIDPTREQVIDDFRELAGAAYDEQAMSLALLTSLVWLGWNKALDAAEHPDPAIRARERADLDWWINQAAITLDAGLLEL